MTEKSNLPLHYKWEKTDELRYIFNTESGIQYTAYFLDSGLDHLYFFNLERVPKDEAESRNNNKIENTVRQILSEFFTNTHKGIVYVCDSTDGRHRSRERVFSNWFRRAGCENIEKHSAAINDIHVSLLVHKDNPKKHEYLNSLNEDLDKN